MTIKKATGASDAVAEMAPVTGGATIADRFKLDIPAEKTTKGPGKSTAVAFIAGLAALAVVGILTFVMYQHWEVLKDA